MSIPKIVILGAGYGGVVSTLNLQKALQYNEAEIHLVNKHEYHYITTELHQPAAGTLHADKARVDINTLIDKEKVTLVKDMVVSIKTEEKKVILEHGELEYDYLVVGLGSEPETFGIQGLKEHAFTIRTLNGVREIREHVEYQFARYKTHPEELQHCLTIVCGGAGFTGIEFVGELADRIPGLCKEFDVDQSLVRIVNVEAAPTALPGFDSALVDYAVEVLQKKGVEFKIDTPILECTSDSVLLDGEEKEIKTATIVWTGGVRGNHILEESGFETMRGRIKVDEYLRAPGYDDVYIVGDCALIINEEQNRPYPPTAQMAIQHGETVSHNIVAAIRQSPFEQFQPKILGTVASLGKNEAVGIIGKRKIVGNMASWLKKLIDLRYLYTIGGLWLVLRKGRFK